MSSNDTQMIVNPFGGNGTSTAPTQLAASAASDQERAIAEVTSKMKIAKMFPRDQRMAMDEILNECSRPKLAEAALYSYAKGGTDITGPSIRLAEAIVRNWGHIVCGVRELSQRNGVSDVEAFAWDMQSNVTFSKTFSISHTRHTRNGSYTISDPREIYEMVANNGSRRLRACILALIPGDVVEAAVEQCEATLRTKIDVTPERINAMVSDLGKLGVTKKQIEAFIQRRIDTMTPALYLRLGKIYNSLKDGMSSPTDWFPPAEDEAPATGSRTEQAKAALGAKKDDDPRSNQLIGEDVLALVAAAAQIDRSVWKNWLAENADGKPINKLNRAEFLALEKFAKAKIAESEAAANVTGGADAESTVIEGEIVDDNVALADPFAEADPFEPTAEEAAVREFGKGGDTLPIGDPAKPEEPSPLSQELAAQRSAKAPEPVAKTAAAEPDYGVCACGTPLKKFNHDWCNKKEISPVVCKTCYEALGSAKEAQ